MKTLTKFQITLILFLGLIMTYSCVKENKPYKYQGENKLSLGFDKSNQPSVTLLCLTNQSTEANIELTTTLNYPVKITCKTDFKNIDQYINIEPKVAVIKPGERKASFKISVLENGMNVSKDTTVKLTFTPDDKDIKPHSLTFKLTGISNPYLNNEQIKMIMYYKKTYNLDLLPLIGKYSCNGTYQTYYEELGEVQTLSNQVTVVTLSPLATKERPILAMPNNAFGLSSYFESLFRYQTIENMFWYYKDDLTISPPSPLEIMKKINYSETSKETYDVGVYTIEIDPQTKNIKTPFLMNIRQIVGLPIVDKANDVVVKKNGKCDDDKQFVIYLSEDRKKEVFFPFIFNFSVWNRCIEYYKTHLEDTDFSFAVKTGNISPYQILNNTTVDKDKWIGERDGDEPTNFVEPKFTIDINKKEIYLQVCRDSWGGSEDSGYTWFKITCKKIDK